MRAVESKWCVYARGTHTLFFSVYYLFEDLSETLREAYIQPLEAIRVKKKVRTGQNVLTLLKCPHSKG